MTIIRDYRSDDAPAIAELYLRSVQEIGVRDYSTDQVRAWASLAPSPEGIDAKMSDGRAGLVAVDSDTGGLLAFADLERDGHIHFLYAVPEAVGRGVASTLYDAIEARARDWGLTRLYSEASEGAVRLFAKKGFVTTARRDLEIDGVAIHNYAVEKRLDPA